MLSITNAALLASLSHRPLACQIIALAFHVKGYCRELLQQFPLRSGKLHAYARMCAPAITVGSVVTVRDSNCHSTSSISPSLAVFSRNKSFQTNALIEWLLVSTTTAGNTWNGSSQVPAEGLLGRYELPTFVFAPSLPRVVE